MRISPFGLWIAFWNSVRLASSKPSWVRSTFSAPLSRMRSVTLSPKSDGSTDIRKSTSCPFGRIKLRQNGHEVDFRMSVLPSLFGESVTLRILDKGALKVDLTQLGFEEASLTEFQKAIQSPNGLILIPGRARDEDPEPERTDPHHGPDRGRQDDDALLGPERRKLARPQHCDRRGSGGVRAPRHHAGASQRGDRAHLRHRAPLIPAPRPRRDPGR